MRGCFTIVLASRCLASLTSLLELHHPISHHLKVCCLGQSIHTTLAQFRSGHCRLLNSYKAHITSGISDVCPECGTTLRRASVQLSKPSDATYSARLVGQPGCGRRLPQPGQLMIEELLGYHNNNNKGRLLYVTVLCIKTSWQLPDTRRRLSEAEDCGTRRLDSMTKCSI